jgi:hypothetical protein
VVSCGGFWFLCGWFWLILLNLWEFWNLRGDFWTQKRGKNVVKTRWFGGKIVVVVSGQVAEDVPL